MKLTLNSVPRLSSNHERTIWSLLGVALIGVVAWELWLILATSHSAGDFTLFYAIGHYLVSHQLAPFLQLYSYHTEAAAAQLYGLASPGKPLTIPFVNPPTAVLPFLLLAHFSLGQAYVIWDLTTFVIFAGALIWLSGTWQLLTPRGVIVLVCLASFPVLINLAEGDLDFLIAIGMVLVIQAQQRSWRAGGPIGAALISMKPQTLLLWLVPALRTIRLRVVREVLITLVCLAAVSAGLLGSIGLRQMIMQITTIPENPTEHATLLGLIETLFGQGLWVDAIAVGTFLVLALVVWFMWGRYPPKSQLECGYMMAAVTCASLAAAPYDLLQGLAVLVVPAVFVASARWHSGKSLLPILIAIAVVNICTLAGFARYLPLPLTSICLLALAAISAAAWRHESLLAAQTSSSL